MRTVTVLPRTRFVTNSNGITTDAHNFVPARFAVSTNGTTTDRQK